MTKAIAGNFDKDTYTDVEAQAKSIEILEEYSVWLDKYIKAQERKLKISSNERMIRFYNIRIALLKEIKFAIDSYYTTCIDEIFSEFDEEEEEEYE